MDIWYNKKAVDLLTKNSKSLIHPFIVKGKVLQLTHIKDANTDADIVMRLMNGLHNSMIKFMPRVMLLRY
jgi:hypothetical protein